jgi:hypothetical protein
MLRPAKHGQNRIRLMDDMDNAPQSAPSASEGSDSPIERRLVMRLLRIWRDKADPEDMPSREQLTVDDIADSKPFCWTASIASATDARFDWIGDAYAIDKPQTLVGQKLSAAPEGTLIARASAYAHNVITWRVPMSFGGELTHRDGSILLFRSIILPLRHAGSADVTHLLGAANYRVLT